MGHAAPIYRCDAVLHRHLFRADQQSRLPHAQQLPLEGGLLRKDCGEYRSARHFTADRSSDENLHNSSDNRPTNEEADSSADGFADDKLTDEKADYSADGVTHDGLANHLATHHR